MCGRKWDILVTVQLLAPDALQSSRHYRVKKLEICVCDGSPQLLALWAPVPSGCNWVNTLTVQLVDDNGGSSGRMAEGTESCRYLCVKTYL